MDILSGIQLTVKQKDFPSPWNVDNFDGIENGSGLLGAWTRQLP